jgi:hypothetical protein
MPKSKSSLNLKEARKKYGKPKISSKIQEQRRMFNPPYPKGIASTYDTYVGPTSDRPLLPATARQIAEEARTRHIPLPYRPPNIPAPTTIGTRQPILPNTEHTSLRDRVQKVVAKQIPDLPNTSMIHNIGYELAQNRIRNLINPSKVGLNPLHFANPYSGSVDNFDDYRQFVKYNSKDKYKLKL